MFSISVGVPFGTAFGALYHSGGVTGVVSNTPHCCGVPFGAAYHAGGTAGFVSKTPCHGISDGPGGRILFIHPVGNQLKTF